MIKRGLFVLMVALLILPLASASISFSSLDSKVYSLGQDLSISVVLTSTEADNGFFISSLICGSQETEIFRMPMKMAANEQKTIPLSLRLDRSLIGSSSGECFITSTYNGESESSDKFEISSFLDVQITLQSVEFNPGDNVTITGTISKRNSQTFSGTVELSVLEFSENISINVSGTSFSIPLFIPTNAKSTIYSINVNAYESSDGEVTNQGSSTKAFSVKQIPKSLDLAIGTSDLKPGNDLSYTVSLKDQAGDEISGKIVSISIINPSLTLFENSTSISGESGAFKTKTDYNYGSWQINASLNDLVVSRKFNMQEFSTASFSLINDTLIVENRGNIPYNKTIQVMIGTNPQNITLELGLGETKQYVLQAPDGSYPISVNDGSSDEPLGSAFLTGNVIGVKDIADIAGNKYAVIGWIIIILALGWLVFRIYLKRSNKSFYGKTNYYSPIKVSSSEPKSASLSSTSISNGQKEECAVLALKVRNSNEIKSSNSNATEAINIALAKARGLKASVFEQGDFRIIVVPSSAAKENLSLLAAKLLKDINAILSDNNKKYSQKIDYGLGANLGELIVEKVQNKYKFSSIGNTISLARKIAESANNESFISESIRTKAMKDIKVEKKGDYYSVTQIVSRDSHNEFINKFMQRQRQG